MLVEIYYNVKVNLYLKTNRTVFKLQSFHYFGPNSQLK